MSFPSLADMELVDQLWIRLRSIRMDNLKAESRERNAAISPTEWEAKSRGENKSDMGLDVFQYLICNPDVLATMSTTSKDEDSVTQEVPQKTPHNVPNEVQNVSPKSTRNPNRFNSDLSMASIQPMSLKAAKNNFSSSLTLTTNGEHEPRGTSISGIKRWADEGSAQDDSEPCYSNNDHGTTCTIMTHNKPESNHGDSVSRTSSCKSKHLTRTERNIFASITTDKDTDQLSPGLKSPPAAIHTTQILVNRRPLMNTPACAAEDNFICQKPVKFLPPVMWTEGEVDWIMRHNVFLKQSADDSESTDTSNASFCSVKNAGGSMNSLVSSGLKDQPIEAHVPLFDCSGNGTSRSKRNRSDHYEPRLEPDQIITPSPNTTETHPSFDSARVQRGYVAKFGGGLYEKPSDTGEEWYQTNKPTMQLRSIRGPIVQCQIGSHQQSGPIKYAHVTYCGNPDTIPATGKLQKKYTVRALEEEEEEEDEKAKKPERGFTFRPLSSHAPGGGNELDQRCSKRSSDKSDSGDDSPSRVPIGAGEEATYGTESSAKIDAQRVDTRRCLGPHRTVEIPNKVRRALRRFLKRQYDAAIELCEEIEQESDAGDDKSRYFICMLRGAVCFMRCDLQAAVRYFSELTLIDKSMSIGEKLRDMAMMMLCEQHAQITLRRWDRRAHFTS